MLIVVVVKHVYGMENIGIKYKMLEHMFITLMVFTNGMPFKEKGTISLIK